MWESLLLDSYCCRTTWHWQSSINCYAKDTTVISFSPDSLAAFLNSIAEKMKFIVSFTFFFILHKLILWILQVAFISFLLVLAASADGVKPVEAATDIRIADDQDAEEWHGRRYYGYFNPYSYNIYNYYRGPYTHWRGRRSAEASAGDQKTEETHYSGWEYRHGNYGNRGYAYYRPYSYYNRAPSSYSYRYYHWLSLRTTLLLLSYLWFVQIPCNVICILSLQFAINSPTLP